MEIVKVKNCLKAHILSVSCKGTQISGYNAKAQYLHYVFLLLNSSKVSTHVTSTRSIKDAYFTQKYSFGLLHL